MHLNEKGFSLEEPPSVLFWGYCLFMELLSNISKLSMSGLKSRLRFWAEKNKFSFKWTEYNLLKTLVSKRNTTPLPLAMQCNAMQCNIREYLKQGKLDHSISFVAIFIANVYCLMNNKGGFNLNSHT